MTVNGYVLHRRNYRESSLIADVFTQEQGRVSVLCKGVKKKRSVNYCLRPFVRVQLELVDFSDLAILKDAEATRIGFELHDNQLIAGLYLNELLYRLLEKYEPVPAIFQLYEDALEAISFNKRFAHYVRQFEFRLLSELGYGFDLNLDCKGNVIDSSQFYQFNPSEGFSPVSHFTERRDIFRGSDLISISHWELNSTDKLKTCKRLLSIALRPLIGERPLMSAELLKQKQVLLAGVSK